MEINEPDCKMIGEKLSWLQAGIVSGHVPHHIPMNAFAYGCLPFLLYHSSHFPVFNPYKPMIY